MTAISQSQPRSAKTLVERLGRRVAAIRGRVHGAVGTHAYRVFLVTTQWGGSEPGRGEKIATRQELFCGRDRSGRLVPPAVQDAVGYYARFKSTEVGQIEDGSIVVSEISDVGLVEVGISDFATLAEDESSTFEVIQDGRDGSDSPARVMVLDGAPQHDVQGCQWIIRLRPHAGLSTPFGGGGAL